MKDSIVFYRSFYEAIQDLQIEQQAQAYNAIFAYALDAQEPKLTGIVATVFKLIKPQLDANLQRYKNGAKGGRPKNLTETETKPNHNLTKTEHKPKPNQTITETEPNVNVNVNDNDIIYRINGEILNFEIWTQSIIDKSDFIFDEMLMKEPVRINFTDDDVKSHETKCIREGTKFSNQNHFRKSLLGYLKTIEQRKTNGKQLNQKDRIGGIDASAARETLSRLSREPFKPE